MRAKTVVIGGGVMGMAIALKLARRGDALEEPVVLLERDELGAGSSGRSGAILRQHYADSRLAIMARDSMREYAAFEALTARSIGFRRTGVLSIAGPSQALQLEQLVASIETLRTAGIDIQRVGPEEMEELVPGIQVEEGSVGLWESGGGFLDPRRAVEAFASLARTYGVVTRLGVEAQEIEIEEGRVVRVEAGGETYETENVVVSAGAGSRRLLAESGYSLPLRAIRSESVFLRLPASYDEAEGEASPEEDLLNVDLEDPLEAMSEQLAGRFEIDARIHPVILDLEKRFYARCEPGEGRTRIGRTDYDTEAVFEDPSDLGEEAGEQTRAWVRDVVAQRMPVYARESEVGSQAAWYTLTPDSQAVIGALPDVEGLFVATGFSGHGLKLAPSVAEGVAQMVNGEVVSAFDPELFSPSRFAEEPEWTGAFGLV